MSSPHAAAALELDLAFAAAGELAPQLLAAAASEQQWQRLFQGWLQQLHAELPPSLQAGSYSLGLSLVSDAEIAALNSTWRQRQGATDVLAFAAQDADRDGIEALAGAPPAVAAELELGDIVISLETAARQAPEHGNSLSQELQFLASHGLLHLLGWDHPDEASLNAMLSRQSALIAASSR